MQQVTERLSNVQIEIFDVGHGQCAVATAPNGNRLMLDCGTRWRDDRFWTPSLHFFKERFEMLALLNLDEDHLADFGQVMEHCTVPWVLSNPTVGHAQFHALKTSGMGRGAQAVAKWLAAPKALNGLLPQPDFGQVQVRWYYNHHTPGWQTNDLSLVVVLQFGLFKIMFAGDLERKGWRQLLQLADFRNDLLGTNIFVASHHGRESGCCEDLFYYFTPEIVIISDDEKQHQSQETNAWYRQRCSGASVIANPSERRYVMTTRNDGCLRINANASGLWRLDPFNVEDWPRTPKASPLGALNAFTNPLGATTIADILRAPPPRQNSLTDLPRLANPLSPGSDFNSLLRYLAPR